MTIDLNATIAAAIDRARSTGALQPIATRVEVLQDEGLDFVLRVMSGLRRKEESDARQRREPQANPFLPYDPAMFVANLSDGHVLLLNKFPVLDGHVMAVTRAFAEQEAPLEAADFAAVAAVLAQTGGLAFFNAGIAAGASQRHRHVQLLPWPLLPATQARPFDPAGWATAGRGTGWPFPHAWRALDAADLAQPVRLALRYEDLRRELGLGDSGYNLLMTPRWMLLVPRRQGAAEGYGVNALGFAGTLLLRSEEDLPRLRQLRPLTLLRAVSG